MKGTFSKNRTWNYEKGEATREWVNAQGFKITLYIAEEDII